MGREVSFARSPFAARMDRQLCCIWLSVRQGFWSLAILSQGKWNPSAFYLLYWYRPQSVH